MGLFVWGHRRSIQSKTLFGTFLLLCIGVLLYSLLKPGRVYNISVFAPLLFVPFLAFDGLYIRSWLARLCAIGILAGSCIGFVRTAALFPVFMRDGISLDKARIAFAQTLAGTDRRPIGISSGFWTLSEEYSAMHLWERSLMPKESSMLFYQQNYNGLLTPPAVLNGCLLEQDAFVHAPPLLFGMRLGNTVPGYAYARYDCSLKKAASE
jgi:hypothetical protein